ncbi:MAG: DUF1289 domain-containing protein [Rhodobacteraceae bacterium]|nr:DUF1289 domain-containing protein [Paracoccaceae bacterium]
MTDGSWKRDEIDSPCVKVCVVHPKAGICVGCHRSVDEISRWSGMSAPERAAISAELPGRAHLLKGRRRRGRSRSRPA